MKADPGRGGLGSALFFEVRRSSKCYDHQSMRAASGDAIVPKYYSVAGQRVAMSKDGVLSYLLTDHLGSVSAVLDDSGALVSEQRYLPFGGERPSEGISETDFGCTGQRDLAAAGL